MSANQSVPLVFVYPRSALEIENDFFSPSSSSRLIRIRKKSFNYLTFKSREVSTLSPNELNFFKLGSSMRTFLNFYEESHLVVIDRILLYPQLHSSTASSSFILERVVVHPFWRHILSLLTTRKRQGKKTNRAKLVESTQRYGTPAILSLSLMHFNTIQ